MSNTGNSTNLNSLTSATANAFFPVSNQVTTSGSTLVLTATSAQIQAIIAGSVNQTIQMPVVSTLTTNSIFYIVNSSGNNIIINSSGSNFIQEIEGNGYAFLYCISTSGTSASSWFCVSGQQSLGKGDNVTFSNVFTGNTIGNNAITGLSTTATAAGTTTLNSGSNYTQVFTGSTTQTIVLPSLVGYGEYLGYNIINQSTGTITIQSFGTNTINTLAQNKSAIYKGITTAADTAAAWIYWSSTINT